MENKDIALNDLIKNYALKSGIDALKALVINYVWKLFPSLLGTFWGGLIVFIVGKVFEKLIIPACQDLGITILAWDKKQHLHTRVKIYENAQTDAEIDSAFDDLISGH